MAAPIGLISWTQDIVKRRLPILTWIGRYSVKKLRGDVIAGMTVGLMVVPQGLAYAHLAMLPYQYGLFAAMTGVIVYTLLGTAKDVTVGPTAIMSLLVAAAAQGDVGRALTLTVMAGCIQLFMGLVKLGVVVDFISRPVLSGFTSAASITIAFSQVHHVLGLQHIRRPFVEAVADVFRKIDQTRLGDVAMGVSCMVLVEFLKHAKKRWAQQSKVMWVIGTARNALIVVLGAIVAVVMCAESGGLKGCASGSAVTLIGDMPAGLPQPVVPSFDSTLVVQAVVVALIGLLESISIAKVFARDNGYHIDVEQEMVALGAANVVSSFLRSYPVTGSFSRTAVNSQSGVRTPMAGLVTGSLVMVSLLVLTPYFYYIPQAALAAIIICAVLTMFDGPIFVELWRTDKVDFSILVIAFVGCLGFGIEYGMIAAIVLEFVVLLYQSARPGFTTLGVVSVDGTPVTKFSFAPRTPASANGGGTGVGGAGGDSSPRGRHRRRSNSGMPAPLLFVPMDFRRSDVHELPAGVLAFRFNGALMAPAVSTFRDALDGLEDSRREEGEPVQAVVLDMAAVVKLDSTGSRALSEYVGDRELRGVQVHLCQMTGEVHRRLSQYGLLVGVGTSAPKPTVGSSGGHGHSVVGHVPAQQVHESLSAGVAAAVAYVRGGGAARVLASSVAAVDNTDELSHVTDMRTARGGGPRTDDGADEHTYLLDVDVRSGRSGSVNGR